MVPPVATRRTRGRSAAGACADADGGGAVAVACAADRLAPASVKRRAARIVTRIIAPLYLTRCDLVMQREPTAQVFDGQFGGGTVERHHGAQAARRSFDLCPPPVGRDGRNLDAIFAAVDRFVEALHVHRRSS